MGTLRASSPWGRGRTRRIPAVLCLVGAAVAGAVACEPIDGLNSASVALTTDRTGTGALERKGVDVRWLNCTAEVEGGGATRSSPSPSASVRQVAQVDCRGRTVGGKDITLAGKVTKEVNGACVRGDLTGRVGDRTVLRADALGNCDAAPSTGGVTPPTGGGAGGSGGGGGGARPTVTVTVTVTEYPGGK
ncbi:hypothetical protein ACFYWN_09495 [Streptomyces sp. NPDC002917]|uniref:hypothetical protein n=1 Tax=unclassified Streptomyces TaxID=2593676 RepID=UPI002E81EFC5|nr:hypothetical protein [Streptomyces sp. NBC_00562]WTD33380.1 hypothetical protein OHB03_14735 [Streptomyces sp. NBC_01643]WUC19870.1 hypothetical protein OHA33_13890 [Streptomyces sp. NBC_00562]